MRRIVVTEFISVDGVIDSPGGDNDFVRGGWTFRFQDDEGFKYKLDEVMEHDALLLGRRTYDGFAAAWPGRTDEAGFADRMNSMPKYVVSTTLENPEWENTTVISENVPAALAELKQGEGGDILVAGSADLIQTLISHDLVDEWRLMTFPVVLGVGKKLFGDYEDMYALELADSKVLKTGTLILTYRRAS
jgi:dihydrofolate reductase